MTITKTSRYLAAVTVLLVFSSAAMAQTGAELLLRPWPKGQMLQLEGSAMVAGNGSTRNSDDFDISFYDTAGRLRLFPEQRADPRFGWNYTHINTSGDPALPSNMIDTSVAFGMGIADWNGWLAGITVGLGYAGAGAYDDSDAWYGMADLLVGRDLGNDSSIGFVIDYDGNRTFLPDVPLPGFLYTKRIFPQVLLGLGFPFSSIEYKPNDQLTLAAKFYVPDQVQARVDYEVVQTLGLFVEYTSRQEAFHWDALSQGSDRLIYDSRRAEAGVRWEPLKDVNVILAGGYLFDQEFNVGWDTRDQDRVAKPSDEPYVRMGVEIRY
jgi:hypothetical protein